MPVRQIISITMGFAILQRTHSRSKPSKYNFRAVPYKALQSAQIQYMHTNYNFNFIQHHFDECQSTHLFSEASP